MNFHEVNFHEVKTNTEFLFSLCEKRPKRQRTRSEFSRSEFSRSENEHGVSFFTLWKKTKKTKNTLWTLCEFSLRENENKVKNRKTSKGFYWVFIVHFCFCQKSGAFSMNQAIREPETQWKGEVPSLYLIQRERQTGLTFQSRQDILFMWKNFTESLILAQDERWRHA